MLTLAGITVQKRFRRKAERMCCSACLIRSSSMANSTLMNPAVLLHSCIWSPYLIKRMNVNHCEIRDSTDPFLMEPNLHHFIILQTSSCPLTTSLLLPYLTPKITCNRVQMPETKKMVLMRWLCVRPSCCRHNPWDKINGMAMIPPNAVKQCCESKEKHRERNCNCNVSIKEKRRLLIEAKTTKSGAPWKDSQVTAAHWL